jgi:hypothetical protein
MGIAQLVAAEGGLQLADMDHKRIFRDRKRGYSGPIPHPGKVNASADQIKPALR